MKKSQINVRTTYAQKQKLRTLAEDKGVTLSKEVNDMIQNVSVQLAKSDTNTPLAEKTADILEQALRLLTKIQSVELATPETGNRSAEMRVFDLAEAILQFAQLQVEGKPINAVLSAIKKAKINQEIKRIR